MPSKLAFSIASCSGEVRGAGLQPLSRPGQRELNSRLGLTASFSSPLLAPPQDPDFPATELLYHSPDSKGWCTPRSVGRWRRRRRRTGGGRWRPFHIVPGWAWP